MRLKNLSIANVVAALCVGVFMAVSASLAVQAAPLPAANYFHGWATDATESFSTTSYADVTDATVSVPAATESVAYNETNAPGTPTRYTRLKITWAATGSKATATTGTCGVYVNSALLATSERVVATAAQSTMAGVVLVARTANTAQTVKLQCKSGDTNAFTVTNSQILVEEVVR